MTFGVEETPEDRVEAIPDAPSDPGDVASAARSCSVILILLLALSLIVCVIVAVTILR